VAGNLDGEVFYSPDAGESWTTIATGIGHVSKGGHWRALEPGGSQGPDHQNCQPPFEVTGGADHQGKMR